MGFLDIILLSSLLYSHKNDTWKSVSTSRFPTHIYRASLTDRTFLCSFQSQHITSVFSWIRHENLRKINQLNYPLLIERHTGLIISIIVSSSCRKQWLEQRRKSNCIYFRSLAKIPMRNQQDYMAMISALGTRFGSHHLKQFCMKQPKTRIQYHSETFANYTDASDQFAHELGVSSFIDAVRDIQLPQALRRSIEGCSGIGNRV